MSFAGQVHYQAFLRNLPAFYCDTGEMATISRAFSSSPAWVACLQSVKCEATIIEPLASSMVQKCAQGKVLPQDVLDTLGKFLDFSKVTPLQHI